MKLSVLDRMQLLAILPTEGNLLNLQIVRRLVGALSFTESEFVAYGLEYDKATNMSRWTRNGHVERDYEFKLQALALIKDAFQRLNDAGKLTPDLVGTAEKFLAGEAVDDVVTAAPVAAMMPPVESKNGDVLEAAVVG